MKKETTIWFFKKAVKGVIRSSKFRIASHGFRVGNVMNTGQDLGILRFSGLRLGEHDVLLIPLTVTGFGNKK